MLELSIQNSALIIFYNYISSHYNKREIKVIVQELEEMGIKISELSSIKMTSSFYNYDDIQTILSKLNEKEEKQKSKGVYYTPRDIVKFILMNSTKLYNNILDQNNIHIIDMHGFPYNKFCYHTTYFDPTCGAGEFLISIMEFKFDLLNTHRIHITKNRIRKVIATIYGNDINEDSILITKLRIMLSLINSFGANSIKGIGEILNHNYTCYDFMNFYNRNIRFDIIIGNPPYVEDSKYDGVLEEKYGNVYANILVNSLEILNNNGVLGYIIPISYISTPRMSRIRNYLFDNVKIEYILNYSDRPDCLFPSVHQKLSILIAKKGKGKKEVYTNNYRYWYKSERDNLFISDKVIRNSFINDEYIPKFGNEIDIKIFKKVLRQKNDRSIDDSFIKSGDSLFLSMRGTFWIKCFLSPHTSSEYKKYSFNSENERNFIYCLLNSSLFWWYWICVSDCWHITKKELKNFKIIDGYTDEVVKDLANKLESKLENTKLYVGTKQTEYEYKHKLCLKEIYNIDNYICRIYGLNYEETNYIKQFSIKYRVGE